MNGEELKNLIEKLIEAKESVEKCLNDEAIRVGGCGITYWAGEVDRLRKEIKELL